jgi:hypothetical protein
MPSSNRHAALCKKFEEGMPSSRDFDILTRLLKSSLKKAFSRFEEGICLIEKKTKLKT